MGNFGILVIGAVLILAVLFIGYKMDTASNRSQARKAAKSVKEKKAKLNHSNEYTDKEESDIYANENLNDMHYESDEDESYESDYVSQSDLVEDEEYEEDDISLFEKQNADDYTFNNDIDDEIAFDTYVPEEDTTESYEQVQEFEEVEEPQDFEQEPEQIAEFNIFEPESEPETDFVTDEVEEIIEPEPKKAKKTRGRPRKNKDVEEAPKAKKGKKAKEEVEEVNDFSSTMIFDVDKLNNEIDRLDEDEPFTVAKEQEMEYSDAVDIDAKISALDDDNTFSEPITDGPFKPVEEDAQSFMDKINKMKEAASVDDFSGFSVDNRDEDLQAVHKKYTKKKTEDEINRMDDNQISFIQDNQDEPTDSVDIGFLAEMEKTLKQNQKDRMTKNRKKKDE